MILFIKAKRLTKSTWPCMKSFVFAVTGNGSFTQLLMNLDPLIYEELL